MCLLIGNNTRISVCINHVIGVIQFSKYAPFYTDQWSLLNHRKVSIFLSLTRTFESRCTFSPCHEHALNSILLSLLSLPSLLLATGVSGDARPHAPGCNTMYRSIYSFSSTLLLVPENRVLASLFSISFSPHFHSHHPLSSSLYCFYIMKPALAI